MQAQPTIGASVKFDFPVNPVLRRFHGERKTGSGVVIGETVVGSELAAIIEVTASADYEAGEVIHVRNNKVWAQ